MKRVVAALALGLLAAPLVAEAQQPGKVARMGMLMTGSPSAARPLIEGFRQGLRELGYSEGQNLAIEYRWVEGKVDQFRDAAADLVRVKVDVILAWGTTAVTAAKQTTSTVPIIFVAVGDPVGTGVVSSLARPGANITGLTNISAELSAKLLELLKEVVPGLTRVAVLRNPTNPVSAPQLRWTEIAAHSLAVQLQVVEVRDPRELEAAFVAMTKEKAGALTVLADPMFLSQRIRIAELAAKSRLPATFNWRHYAEAGGLLAYGPAPTDDEVFRVVELEEKGLATGQGREQAAPPRLPEVHLVEFGASPEEPVPVRVSDGHVGLDQPHPPTRSASLMATRYRPPRSIITGRRRKTQGEFPARGRLMGATAGTGSRGCRRGSAPCRLGG